MVRSHHPRSNQLGHMAPWRRPQSLRRIRAINLPPSARGVDQPARRWRSAACNSGNTLQPLVMRPATLQRSSGAKSHPARLRLPGLHKYLATRGHIADNGTRTARDRRRGSFNLTIMLRLSRLPDGPTLPLVAVSHPSGSFCLPAPMSSCGLSRGCIRRGATYE
jgi:hypothetical protein